MKIRSAPGWRALSTALWLLAAGPSLAMAELADRTLADVGFDQRLNAQLPMRSAFRDTAEQSVTLGSLLGDKPAILAPVYYDCPNLCGLTMAGLAEALSQLDLRPGKDFHVVLVSIDPKEDAASAVKRRDDLQKRYPKAGISEGWTFLTGEPSSIQSFARTIGFKYAYDKQRMQYAHPAGLVLATPDGVIDRYLFGVRFREKDLRLGLLDSGKGRIGTLLDQVVLLCYHFDPLTGRYSLLVIQLLRVAGIATALGLGLIILRMLLRERSARGRKTPERKEA